VSGKVRGKRTSRSVRTRKLRQQDTIVNRQRMLRVPVRQLEEFLARARRALRLAPGSIGICLVSNSEIAKWNHAYRHKHGPTDVLSFPAEAEAAPRRQRKSVRDKKPARAADRFFGAVESPRGYLGDIAIAPAVARRNASMFGRTFSEEMRILILHGMLHLMGYDHEADTGQMDRRESRLRRQLGLG
jgi:probable rRNA maturation factor